MAELKLLADGTLLHSKWIYDETIGEGSYVIVPVTERFGTYLNVLDKTIEFDSKVTLASLCELLLTHDLKDDALYQYLFNNCYLGHFIRNYQHNIGKFDPYVCETSADIEYLEVYRLMEIDSVTLEADTLAEPAFHGVAMKTESNADPLNICVSWCNPVHFYNTPIRLNTLGELWDCNHELIMKRMNTKEKALPILQYTYDYTLREVIRAVFWELSWGGPPPLEDKAD